MGKLATLLWFVAAALAWGCLDLAQVRATIGNRGFVALAVLVQTVYAAFGLMSGLIFLAVNNVAGSRVRGGVSGRAVAIVSWGLIVVGAYVNIVYLPKPTAASALLFNLALLVAAFPLGWLVSRVMRIEPLARAGTRSACAVAMVAIATGVGLGAERPDRADQQVMPAISDGPDVFVIVIDTLRFDRTSLNAEGPKTTPYIETLASEATVFERAYAQSSWTKPSVASLFTSLYPSTHDANLRRDRLASEAETLPELFRAAGYDTAVFSANPWISPSFGFDQGVAHFIESEPDTFVRLVVILRLIKLADRVLPGRIGASAVHMLEDAFRVRAPRRTNCLRDVVLVDAFDRWMARGGSRPRFAYLHLMSPHIPYEPPGREGVFPRVEQVALLQSTEPLPPEKHSLLLSLYDATVEHADAMVGRIIGAIRAHGDFDASIVIVTSDHGEEFFEHGRWGHGKSLYEEVVRVPLLVKGPDVVRGRRVESPVMIVDVVPTLAALVGLDVRFGWEGEDLRSIPSPRGVYAELLREGGVAWYMLLDVDRKYIERRDTLGTSVRRELYHLGSDPAETRNLASARDDALHSRLMTVRRQAAAKRLGGAVAEIDEDADERLRALGYVN